MHFKKIVESCMVKKGTTGCGECASSCQSACKTSCTVGNQSCMHKEEKINIVKKENN